MTVIDEERPAPTVAPSPASGAAAATALLERVADGDREAFAALYDELAPAVHGLALRLVREPFLAEEVTQDVFLAVWQKAASFTADRGTARTWVLTLAHRRAVDVVRREQSQRDRSARAAILDTRAPHDEVADEVLARVTAELTDQQVGRALDALTPLQRRTITLAFFEGLTYPQVAERLSIPLSTAKTRIRDGLRRMARELAPESAAP